MKGYIGGLALPTNVTFGKCIPSMLCVVVSGCISNRYVFTIVAERKLDNFFLTYKR